MSSKPFDPEDTQEFVLDWRNAPQFIVVYTPVERSRKKRYSRIQFPSHDVPQLAGYTSIVVEIEPDEDLAWLCGWREI